jgi:tetratricopeptide (TPR) repeat protein
MGARVLIALLAIAAGLGASRAATFEEVAARAARARSSNDIPRAMEAYREAVRLKPAWAEGWWFLGTLAYDSDHYADGKEAFSHFVRIDAKAAPGWSLLGLCEFETGDYAASLEHIQRGLQLSAAGQSDIEEVLRFHEAMLLARAGRFDAALQKYGWFARRGVTNPQLLAAAGLAALRIPALPASATETQREAASVAGRTVYAWMRKEFPDAEEGFRALLSRFSSTPNVHYLYASYLLPSRPADAMLELQRELAVNPGSADARAMIALAFVRHEDLRAALPYAKRAAEEGASVPMAQYIYGLVLAKTGDPQGAAPRLESAVKLDPANVEYHMALATAYSRIGRDADARKERLETLSLAQEDSLHAP